MQNISDVFIVNVSGIIEHRDTKHCVCVSVSDGKYLFINTRHRDIYNDFKIKADDYEFLNSIDRFVSCSKIRPINVDRIKKKVGNLNRNDMMKIVDKIQASETLDKIEKVSIVTEINKWLSENS